MADDDAELARIRRIVHALVCRDGLSVQVAQQKLESFAIQRTPELIEQDLEAASCEHCAAQAAQPEPGPEPEPARPVHHPAVQSGWLTGMIERDGR